MSDLVIALVIVAVVGALIARRLRFPRLRSRRVWSRRLCERLPSRRIAGGGRRWLIPAVPVPPAVRDSGSLLRAPALTPLIRAAVPVRRARGPQASFGTGS